MQFMPISPRPPSGTMRTGAAILGMYRCGRRPAAPVRASLAPPMPRGPLALLLAALALPAPAGASGAAAAPGSEVVSLRFDWPAPSRARVTHRRTRLRTGKKPSVFTARYETLAERDGDELRLATRATAWRGDLPYARALAQEAMRASERVVQRIRADGEFVALDGVEALRPVLARVLDRAKVPSEQAERALALALAATSAEAEELWNLAVGFWTGADLRLGETYTMQGEGELPLLRGVRAPQAVEFNVRRRVPCAAGERGWRCVEAVLRSTPDRAALERAAPRLLALLSPEASAAEEGSAADLAAESELVLVTDPATLLPRRLVWTRAVRLAAREDGPPQAEVVDRAEYDWRWVPAKAPPKPEPQRKSKPTPTPTPTATPTATATGDR
jgi:hypothetical protein